MRPGRPSVRPLAIALGAAALVIAPACMWVIERDAGNRVTVISTPTEWPAGVDPTSPTLTLADGTEVRVDAAYLGWRRVALSPCAEARSFGGVARAHGGTSRNVIEATLVEHLVGDEAVPLAELAPATGRYCRLSIGAGAVDAGADGAPDDGSFDGYSLWIDGALRPAGTPDWRPFALRETASFDVVLPLDGISIEGGAALEVTVSKAAAAWFDGVDLFADGAAREVLERVQRSIALEGSW